MMRRRRQQRLAEQMRRDALAAGRLRDISSEARLHGIDVPVAISQSVWTSLVRPFPSARQREGLSVASLLANVRTFMQQESPVGRLRVYTPAVRPEWLSGVFTLRLRFNYSGDRLVAILICAEGEHFAYKVDDSADLLPAGLLVRLHQLVLDLSLVCRTAESKLVERLWAMTKVLLRPSPARMDIDAWFARRRPTLPPSFSREEYRLVLLQSLAELLILMEACGSQANYVVKLVGYYQAMVSPLCELAERTEWLLKLAARLPDETGPLQDGAFRHLLAAFHTMQSALDCGCSAMPASVLLSVQSELVGLCDRLGEKHAAEMDRLQVWFEQLDCFPPTEPVIDLRYRSEEKIVWQ